MLLKGDIAPFALKASYCSTGAP